MRLLELVQSPPLQQPRKGRACRQPPGFPEPEDSHRSGSCASPLSAASSSADRATRFYCPPAGGAARAHTRCLARVRLRTEHPAPNLAQVPPAPRPHPRPPRLQPPPAGRLHGCCHLVRCRLSLLCRAAAGACSLATGGGREGGREGGRCWAAPLPCFGHLRAEPWCQGRGSELHFGLPYIYALVPCVHPK